MRAVSDTHSTQTTKTRWGFKECEGVQAQSCASMRQLSSLLETALWRSSGITGVWQCIYTASHSITRCECLSICLIKVNARTLSQLIIIRLHRTHAGANPHACQHRCVRIHTQTHVPSVSLSLFNQPAFNACTRLRSSFLPLA